MNVCFVKALPECSDVAELGFDPLCKLASLPAHPVQSVQNKKIRIKNTKIIHILKIFFHGRDFNFLYFSFHKITENSVRANIYL